jgi:REP element-mobilizing transposase RayT
MFTISKDTPAYFITSVTHNRLPVFQTSKLKDLVCSALDEVRKSAKLLFFAYVVMHDHLHTLVGSSREPSEVLRYVNGIISRRVIDYLKVKGFDSSLRKLSRGVPGERKHRYSLWDHHPNLKRLTDEGVFMQKVHYIHQNPVRAGLVESAEEYRWSSIRCWNKSPTEDEPLLMDISAINWKSRKA